MSGGEGRKLTNQDIQLVQNRVEQCLQHYMDKKELINTLIIHDNIEPRVTELGNGEEELIQEQLQKMKAFPESSVRQWIGMMLSYSNRPWFCSFSIGFWPSQSLSQ